jgi:predicted ATPase/class 3 adenylate cyclase
VNDQRVSLAVMFTDIQGFSAMMSADEATTVRVVREHRVIVREALAEHGGRELRTIGDAFLVVFDDPAAAVACSTRIQRRLGERNRDRPVAEQVWVRIGLHWGDVLVGGEGELYGDTVNIAARVEPHAPAGGICATDTLVARAGDFAWESVGVVPLKNISAPISLYRATISGPAPGAVTAGEVTFSGNVPRATTKLVGRERDLEAAHRLLLDGVRVITLLGPGGVGKTTLLGEIGRTVGPGWSGGVWFVELAAATDLVAVGSAAAAALGVAPGSDPIGAVGGALRARKRTLLLLDNAEQAVDAVARAVSAWVDAAPDVTCVVTSRERLALADERLFPVDGLAADPAVALFAERARAVRPDFAVTDTNRAAVERLVARLDRMPLAIELFASRLRLEPLDRLAARLDEHLDLRSGRRDGPARQATLRSAIAWSWGLLRPEERLALAKLTVFRGPIPVDGAEAVLGDDALPIVESLVDKSLLRASDEGLRFYESIRAFAAEHLPDGDDARARHAAYWAARAESAGPGGLKPHRDDLPLAFETSLSLRRAGDAASAWLAWNHSGRANTPLRALLAAADRVPALEEDALAARFGCMRAIAIMETGDPPAAEAVALEALERARRSGRRLELALTLRSVATVRLMMARIEDARPFAEEALRYADDDLTRALVLQTQSLVHSLTNTPRMCELLEETARIADRIGHPIMRIVAHHNTALALLGQDRVPEALAMSQRNLAASRQLEEPIHAAVALSAMTTSYNLLGDFALARASAQEGASIARAFGFPRWIAANLSPMAVAQAALGEPGALDTAEEALAIMTAAGDPRENLLGWLNKAWALALLGRPDEALPLWEDVDARVTAVNTDRRSLVGALLAGAKRAIDRAASV